MRKIATKVGAVDKPGTRRINTTVIPRLGGIAILFGFLAPILGIMLFTNPLTEAFKNDTLRIISLFSGSIAIATLGAIDDIRNVRAIHKLLVQLIIAISAYFGGFQINLVSLPFVGLLHMGIFALPVTVLWIVGIINAVNLIDGLDGLAAGVSFFVCIVNFTIGLLSGNALVALYAAALGGALIGFLIFNFNPATIFMGDTGSMLIGFILATTSLMGVKGGTAVALLVPILAMGVPIFDTLIAIARRFVAKRPIFLADKGHFHHRLLEMGLTHKKSVLIIYGISILFTATAIAIYLGREKWEVGAALLVSTVLIFIMMRAVGMFHRGERRLESTGEYSDFTLRIKQNLPAFILNIHEAQTLEALQLALDEFCEHSGLVIAQCTKNGTYYLNYWKWVTYHGHAASKIRQISIRHSIQCGEKTENYEMNFGWRSEDSPFDPYADLLLRIVFDSVVEASCKQSKEADRQSD
ncbi:MAG: undecaprenyl/decaprenyl-phosphate alpha-N-acetylglucosaminyl 1-phosphate transferase [Deltaproteobacteria bacterium]|nr:undecaprenyl/decaprenyl-phosphate alpha-N-acetylglucosaminyl 1-phosphate transferase [Deltaproteobacteria bacterium]